MEDKLSSSFNSVLYTLIFCCFFIYSYFIYYHIVYFLYKSLSGKQVLETSRAPKRVISVLNIKKDCESVTKAVTKVNSKDQRGLPAALAWFAFRDAGIKEPSMHFTPHPSKCFLTNTDKASRAPVMDPLGELDETATWWPTGLFKLFSVLTEAAGCKSLCQSLQPLHFGPCILCKQINCLISNPLTPGPIEVLPDRTLRAALAVGIGKRSKRREGKSAWLGSWESIAWQTGGQCNQRSRMKRTGKHAEAALVRPKKSFGIGCLLLFILRGNKQRPATTRPRYTSSPAAWQGLSFALGPHT